MCGLVGAFAFADTATEELSSPVRRLIALMARRGPDDSGEWTDGRRCALGFRRLSILDLSPTGHQPMTSADGRYALVFNGEVYNFHEIRKDLAAKGRTFRSTGDAETVMLALAEWGIEALGRLNGMFALALYDRREHRLLLARDHAGIKPLHYAITPRGIVFGSQYNQIIAHPWMGSPVVDPGALGLYLRFGFVPAPYGLHASTRQLEAGHWLELDANGVARTGAFFELPRWQTPTLTGEPAREAFDEAFTRAVRRHLVSDVPVGVLLSGGVDSPLVAAEARRLHSGALSAFTIEVDHPRHNEGEQARAYARQLGLEHIVERVTEADALGLLEDVVTACTEPSADHSIFPTLLVSRLAHRHVKVVLSGDGGDELFWGYERRMGSAIAQAHYFGWPRLARLGAIGARRFANRGAATRDVLGYPSLGALYQRMHTLLDEDDLAHVFPTLPAVPRDFRRFEFAGVDTDAAAQWVRWNEFGLHLARVLEKVDRASMHHSLEVRVPLLDREVIKTAWRIDWRACLDLKRRTGKQVLRRSLAKRVTVPSGRKRGFAIPMYEWLAGPLRPQLEDLVLNRDELLGLPMDRKALAGLAQQLRAGDRSKAWGLWSLLSLALWSRTHGQRLGQGLAA